MSQPKPDLRQALKPLTNGASTTPQQESKPASSKQGRDENPHFRPSRAGATNITGYYPPAVKKQLRMLAAERETTSQDLLAEALNGLFAKYGKPEIVPIKARAGE